MTIEHIDITTWEAGLAISPMPVFVMDPVHVRLCWTNDAALELWQAESRDELFAREVNSNLPEKVALRRDYFFSQARAGKKMREEWTFYPRGVATMAMLDVRATWLHDGKLGYLFQAIPLVPEASPDLLRTITISRLAAVMVTFVDASGEILTLNTSAAATFGDQRSWRSWFVDPSLADRLIADALARKSVRVQAHVRTKEGLRWHVVDAQPLRDPVTSALSVLVEHRDETARIESEQLALQRAGRIDALTSTLELVEAQRQEILRLSAPLLDVGDHTLAVPIIGRLSETLSEEIIARLLDAVTRRHTVAVLLDLTGVVDVDEDGAARLGQLIGALRLLGATARIAGINAKAAQRLVDAGINFDGVETLRSLADGLRSRGA